MVDGPTEVVFEGFCAKHFVQWMNDDKWWKTQGIIELKGWGEPCTNEGGGVDPCGAVNCAEDSAIEIYFEKVVVDNGKA